MTDTIQITYTGQNQHFYYVRLGALLEYIQKNIMYIVYIDKNSNSPLLKFDTEVETNLMFVENLQISVDPNICLINKTLTDLLGTSYTFTNQKQQAEPFESTLFTGHSCYGQIMNIYVHMKWILLKLDELKDANTGKVVLIDFLNGILSSVNSALGGINNLEATVDEVTNTVIIRDKNPLPNMDLVISTLNTFYKSKGTNKKLSNESAFFDLYGYSTEEYSPTNPTYNKAGHASFIKDFNFTTEITPQLSTMLTVGATADSTVVGENSTAFSRFNRGLTDRFKKSIATLKSPNTNDIISKITIFPTNANSELINDLDKEQKALTDQYGGEYRRYMVYVINLAAPTFKFNNEEADTYKSAVVNFNTYVQQIREILFKKANIKNNTIPPFLPGTGFIPFNMSVTMDGMSGMKIYNKLNINTEYLPTNYPDTAEFLIKNIIHKIENNKWYTTLESIVTVKGKYKSKNGNKLPDGGSNPNPNPNPTPVVNVPLQESVDADFWSLVAISAAENYIDNFQGMADVAQSIYNRLSAKVYGKSIKNIVVAPGQYEPTFKNLNDWYAIKNKETAITAYQNSKNTSLSTATQAINNCVSALTSPSLKQNAKVFIGSRTEFLSTPPSSQNSVGVVEREPKNRNNAFFWNYSGKTLFYNKKILTAQNPPSNLPQLA